MRNAISDFTSYGTQAPTNVRIISEDFDPSVPAERQPAVKMDGSKAYMIQFTRTGQNLCLYPGQEPAPGFVKTSAFKGEGTRWVFLPPSFHKVDGEGVFSDDPRTAKKSQRPEDLVKGEGIAGLSKDFAPGDVPKTTVDKSTWGGAIALGRFGS